MSLKSFLLRFSRVLALVLLSMVVAVLNPNFLKISNLINILRQASPQIIISAGMTIVLLTGGIDLSMGSVVTLASIIAGYVLTQTKLHWTMAIVSALGSGLLCGLVSGILVAKVKLPSAIATYGMLWVGRGLAFAIMGAFPYFGFPNAFRYIGRGILLGIPVPIWIMVAVALVVYLFLKYTTLGKSIYAVGANPYAAKASGLRVDRILIYTYMLSGLLAALGGIILTARLNAVDQDIGAPFLLPAIASP
ncbi:MAG: ABC transporter permease, partial [Anaerolineae bacterium]